MRGPTLRSNPPLLRGAPHTAAVLRGFPKISQAQELANVSLRSRNHSRDLPA